MRGVAIVAIMLHNYIHVFSKAIEENEFAFHISNAELFFRNLFSFSSSVFYDFMSFLGWLGVPVFIFISGYGLVCKYEKTGGDTVFGSKWKFIFRNWLKLFLLILPAVSILVGECLYDWMVTGNRTLYYIAYNLFTLTFLNDPLNPWIGVSPGVYWYLGLALELYIFYAFGVWKRKAWILWTGVAVSVILQIVALPSIFNYGTDMWIEWVRHNITGWLLVFAFGIYYARNCVQDRKTVIIFCILAILFYFPCQLNAIAWQLAPICSVVLCILAAVVISKLGFIGRLFYWIGKLSAFLYVAHPLVRQIFVNNFQHEVPDWRLIACYLVASFIAAIVYRWIWRAICGIPIVKRLQGQR